MSELVVPAWIARMKQRPLPDEMGRLVPPHELPGRQTELRQDYSTRPIPYGTPEESTASLFHKAIGAAGGRLVEGITEPIRKTMGPIYGEMEGTSDDVLNATMMGIGAGWPGMGKGPNTLGMLRTEGPPKKVNPAKLTDKLESHPEYVYHATNEERLFEIAESGKLRTHKAHEFTDQDAWPDGSTEKRSYFSKKADTVWQFAPEDGNPVVIRTKGEGLKRESTGDIYSTKPISSKNIEYLGEDNKWHPLDSLKEEARLVPPPELPRKSLNFEINTPSHYNGVDYQLQRWGKSPEVWVQSIKATEPGKATSFLKNLTGWADENGITLMGDARPMNTNEGIRGLPIDKLKRFYRMHGFEETGSLDAMRRSPRRTK